MTGVQTCALPISGQFAVRDGLGQLAVLVDDPVAVVRLDIGF